MKRYRAVASVLSLMMIISCFCSCGKQTKSVNVSAGTTVVSADGSTDLCVSTASAKNMSKIATSNRITLYFDKTTCSVCVYDSNAGKLWRSLPTSYSKSFKSAPNVLRVAVTANNRSYTLNSQLNSVANGLTTYKKTDSGITVSYSFSFDADGVNAAFSIPVEYRLKDGSLFVSVDCAAITADGETDITINRLWLLNYFGSTLKGKSGDYILVPDGCGAVIRTDKTAKTFEPVTLKVYGSDAAQSTEGLCASVGAFGFKQGNSAAVAIIEQGDAIATVYADTVASYGCNYAGAGFEITASDASEGKVHTASDSYNGIIQLCYRFLSDNNANYAAMAAACREQLIRNDVLSPSGLTEDSQLPIILTLIGAASISGKSSVTTLTTYEQAQDMLTLLKAKGFSNIYLRYEGLFDGGLNQSDIGDFRLNLSVGTQEEFEQLVEYMNAQQLEMYFGIDVLSASSGSYSRNENAKDITGSSLHITNSLPDLSGGEPASKKRSLLRLSELDDTILDVLTAAKELEFTGFCIDDAGGLLYSDYSSKDYDDRQSAMRQISEECLPLVTGRKLMVNGANIYMLKNVSAVNSIPMTTGFEQSVQYIPIPFIQMIIHGSMYYSGAPLNLEGDFETAFLRCVEYGAVPSFEWCYTNIASLQKEETEAQNNYYYANMVSQAYALYEKANEALSDIAGTRITNHYTVQSKVYCTVYAGNTMIYVNYNNEAVEINGTTVEPRSFLRIN